MFYRPRPAAPHLVIDLRQAKELTRRLIENYEQGFTPMLFLFVGRDPMVVPLTVPDERWRPLLIRLLQRYRPRAYAMVTQAVTTLDLSAVERGMEAIPLDDVDEEVMFVVVKPGQAPQMEMAKILRTTKGRKLDTYRKMGIAPDFVEETMILNW